MGDRFAHQAKAQLKAVKMAAQNGVQLTPVWNKSYREHQTIGSDPLTTRQQADIAVNELQWTEQAVNDVKEQLAAQQKALEQMAVQQAAKQKALDEMAFQQAVKQRELNDALRKKVSPPTQGNSDLPQSPSSRSTSQDSVVPATPPPLPGQSNEELPEGNGEANDTKSGLFDNEPSPAKINRNLFNK